MLLFILCFFVCVTNFFTIQARNRENSNRNKVKLSILFVVKSFPVLAETPAINLITGLLDLKHNVQIYSVKIREYFGEMHPDVNKYKLLDRTHFQELPPFLDKFDIIFCQFGPLGELFVKLKKKLGLRSKIVTCFRGYDLSQHIQKYPDAYKELFNEGALFFSCV